MTTTVTSWCRPLIAQVLAMHPVEGLTPQWIEAVVRAESSGQPHAYRFEPRYWDRYCKDHPVFGQGEPFRIAASYGLMQVMYPTAYALGYRGDPEGLFIPQQSLLYGVKTLASNLAWSKGHLPAALAAYNGGKTKDNLTPPYRNGAYLGKVTRHLKDITEGR
jgi:soluble lytic murein transglycosylase-like protein